MSDEHIPSESALNERFPDKFNRRYAGRYLPKVARAAREHDVLGPDEELQACSAIYRMSPWWGWTLLLGIVPFILVVLVLERTAWLLVTDSQVIVTRWKMRLWTPFGHEVMRFDRPVPLSLAKQPKRKARVFTRNRVLLPDEFTAFLGQRTAYIRVDRVAADAFRIAGTPGTPGTEVQTNLQTTAPEAELVPTGTGVK